MMYKRVMKTPEDFTQNIEEALVDNQLRSSLKNAMGLLKGRREGLFADKEDFAKMRHDSEASKKYALSHLPELLEQLEKKCTENGIIVHWAETKEEANNQILEIMRKHDATKIVKGKSMVSEETHLNAFLQKNDIEAIETDLGEFIIQLNDEPPSHIVVPAVHKTRQEIGKIFNAKLKDTPYVDEVDKLNAIARKTLRESFRTAPVGLSGVNFAIAETGTLVLIENEGNGRMCTTVPPVHIAMMGLEKVLATFDDLPPFMRLLPGSATGQLVTTYINCITSPRKEGEKDGPKEIHLIILDNGRSKILASQELRDTLQCIRCGTCLNHCPVYLRIGGHAYGSVYPGPIGTILTPQIEGLKTKGSLTTASSLCDACQEVCPVKIPIPMIIRRLRNEAVDVSENAEVRHHGCKKSFIEGMVWKGWSFAYSTPWAYRLMLKMSGIFGNSLPNVGPLKAWTRVRTKPKMAKKSLSQLVREEGIRNE